MLSLLQTFILFMQRKLHCERTKLSSSIMDFIVNEKIEREMERKQSNNINSFFCLLDKVNQPNAKLLAGESD